jgi:hypothetical protein
MIAWSRSPRTRSGAGIAAIFASTALSPSTVSALARGRAAPFFAAPFFPADLVLLVALRLLSAIFVSFRDADSSAGSTGSVSSRNFDEFRYGFVLETDSTPTVWRPCLPDN